MGFPSPNRVCSSSGYSAAPPVRKRIVGARFLLILWTLLFLLSLFPGTASAASPTIALLVSRNIKPYIEAAEGFLAEMEALSDARISPFFLENYAGKTEDILEEKIRGRGFSLVIAIGPEAARLAYGGKGLATPILYSMVLNPEKILEQKAPDCGVPLNIPIDVQLERIAAHLPELKRIGLLFDPANNEEFYEKAGRVGASMGIDIVPLRASSRSDIPQALQNGQTVDGIWMIPDRTIISESIVQYIIKEMILRRTPTIGYNRFFYDSGAALAFVFDYRALGRQTAQLALSALSGRPCPYLPPVFSTLVNHKVIERLGLKSASKGVPGS